MLRTLLMVLLCLAAPALADDDIQLYDPQAPEGSAFVRFVYAEAGYSAEVTPYVPRPADNTDFESGGYYTIAQKGGGKTVLADPPLKDPAKALLVLYNFSDQEALSLKTADGKITIIENVPPMQNAARALNAVRIDMAVYNGAQKLHTIDPQSLMRGEAYAVFVTQGDHKPALVRAETDTRQ